MSHLYNNNASCALTFTGISSETSEGKKVLHGLSGMFNGGSLVAIMGSSGSGKTTLLNILSGYSYQNAKCNSININDDAVTFEHLSNISCYITQDIHLNDVLNVKENMLYAADFKLGLTYSEEDKLEIINKLLDSFGLSTAQDTRAAKLSGGERKRLALALEMISNPQIIFLDEPTTGLDIATTHQTLSFLKKIANTGKTVICTIHQVSANHLELFDHLYVITDGQCAYQGKPQDLVQFLDQQGLPCSIYHSPTEYLIELCSGEYGDDKRILLVDASRGNLSNRHLLRSFNSNVSDCESDMLSSSSNVTWLYQIRTLFNREAKKLSRNRLLVPMKIIGTNLLSFFLGCLFWDLGNDASKVIFNYQFIFGAIANVFLTGYMYPILSYTLEMPLIKRECYNRNYTIFQYCLVTFLLDLPISVITLSTSSMLGWYMTSQPMEIERILIYQLFILTFGCIVNAVGFFFVTLNLPVGTSLMMCVSSQLPMIAISGYGLLFKDLPKPIDVLSQATYTRNAVQGALIASFGLEHRRLMCPPEEEYCFYKYPHKFLIFVGLDPDHYFHCWVILVVWFVVIKLATYYMMKYRLSS